METEFHGGEANEPAEPEDEDQSAERVKPCHIFAVDVLNSILTRDSEVAAAKKKGRKKHADVQMKVFDDRFHTVLHTPVRPNSVNLQDVQLAFTHPQALTAALQVQDEILKQMRSDQPDVNINTNDGESPDIFQSAVLHNLQQQKKTCQWIDLDEALQGPAHVAKVLIQRGQDKRSAPGKPYKLNAEQLECVALYVSSLEKDFAQRPDPSQPWVHPQRSS